MGELITTADQIESVIGKTPPMINNKVIRRLDDGALRWIAHAPIMFASFSNGSSVGVTIGGGPLGWASGDAEHLHLPAAMLDDPALAAPGVGFGSVFAVSSIDDVMRVNGRVSSVRDGVISVQVEECYLHCGRALIRSDFWGGAEGIAAIEEVEPFVRASRFMGLATADANTNADLSPKGDLAGVMAQLIDGKLWYADRPGNKRVDSFKNIIKQPRVAAFLLIPGSTRIVLISGAARITTDEGVRDRFAVDGKVPALATVIDDLVMSVRESRALAHAKLWPAVPAPEDLVPAKIVLGHYKLNKDAGVRMTGALLSTAPNLLQRTLDKAYRKGLY